MPGFPVSRDLVAARTLLEGIWTPSKGPGMLTRESRAIIGGPGCAYRGPVLPRGGPARLIHPGRIIFPCRMVPLELPMWWGRALFTVWLGNDVRASRLHSVVRGTPDSGYRQGLNLNRSKELECAVDWRTGFSGVPPDSVRCTWAVQVPTSHRLGKTQVRSAIIHRTVRCASGATANSRNGRL
jgi:hypothetical protein